MTSTYHPFLNEVFFSLNKVEKPETTLLNLQQYMFTKKKKEMAEMEINGKNALNNLEVEKLGGSMKGGGNFQNSVKNALNNLEVDKLGGGNFQNSVKNALNNLEAEKHGGGNFQNSVKNALNNLEVDKLGGGDFQNLENNSPHSQTLLPSSGIFKPVKMGGINSLFWCIYIAIHGYTDFSMLSNNKLKREIEEKQKMLDFFMASPTKMKGGNYKMSNVAIEEYCADLQLNKRDGLGALIGFSIFYGANILVLFPDHGFYFEFDSTKDATEGEALPIVLVYDKTEKTFGVNMMCGRMNDKRDYRKGNGGDEHATENEEEREKRCVAQIKQWKEGMLCLENYAKPLKGVSGYKTADLEMMLDKIGVLNDTNKSKKQYMYDALYQHIMGVLVEITSSNGGRQ